MEIEFVVLSTLVFALKFVLIGAAIAVLVLMTIWFVEGIVKGWRQQRMSLTKTQRTEADVTFNLIVNEQQLLSYHVLVSFNPMDGTGTLFCDANGIARQEHIKAGSSFVTSLDVKCVAGENDV